LFVPLSFFSAIVLFVLLRLPFWHLHTLPLLEKTEGKLDNEQSGGTYNLWHRERRKKKNCNPALQTLMKLVGQAKYPST
jgi:hypothetical protein